jgi:hypothetical protein
MWLFVLTMVTATAKAEFDYCTITKKHTMCQSDQGFGDKCGTVLGSGITNQDRQEIVRVHNELRSEIANGRERRGKPGPQPPAANMEQMVISFHNYSRATQEYRAHQKCAPVVTCIYTGCPIDVVPRGKGI